VRAHSLFGSISYLRDHPRVSCQTHLHLHSHTDSNHRPCSAISMGRTRQRSADDTTMAANGRTTATAGGRSDDAAQEAGERRRDVTPPSPTHRGVRCCCVVSHRPRTQPAQEGLVLLETQACFPSSAGWSLFLHSRMRYGLLTVKCIISWHEQLGKSRSWLRSTGCSGRSYRRPRWASLLGSGMGTEIHDTRNCSFSALDSPLGGETFYPKQETQRPLD
jgi:hypothetical protein